MSSRFTDFRRSRRGEGRLVRSDNLRTAPRWITPDLVAGLINLAMPVGGEQLPIATTPTRGVKPKLAVVRSSSAPEDNARQAEEREAVACPPASPPKALHYSAIRKAEAFERLQADRPLFQIAFDRGLAVVDLAQALDRRERTTLFHARRLGFRFGKRPPLAEPITLEQLLALTDPAVQLPELRRDRLKRERLAKWADYKRQKRAPEVQLRSAQREAEAAERRAARRRERDEAARQREQARRDRAEALDQVRRERLFALEQAKADRTAAERKNCEGEKTTVSHPVVPAPSQEPALTLPLARAPTFTVVPTSGAPRHVSYAERMSAAVAHLRARHFVVRRYDPNELIARWQVTGQYGLLANEELVELAVRHGLEFAA